MQGKKGADCFLLESLVKSEKNFPKIPRRLPHHALVNTSPTALELSVRRGKLGLPCLARIDQNLPPESRGLGVETQTNRDSDLQKGLLSKQPAGTATARDW